MVENGYLTIRVYRSDAQIPIVGAAVSVTQTAAQGAHLLAARLTDRSGRVGPIELSAPARGDSLSPGKATPFAAVDITAGYPGYERVLVENVQIFSGVETQQNLELLPLGSRPDAFDLTEVFDISAQPL